MHLNAGYRQEKTWNGHRSDLVKSGLQKYIRRGMMDKALYCAGEMDLFKGEDRGEAVRTNFVHRLMVVFLEDVGVGGLGLWGDVDEMVFGLLGRRSKGIGDWAAEEERLIKATVRGMCRAQKGRCCSHAKAMSSDDSVALMESLSYAGPLVELGRRVRATEAAAAGAAAGGRFEFWRRELRGALRRYGDWTAVHWARRMYGDGGGAGADTGAEGAAEGRAGSAARADAIFGELARVLPAEMVALGRKWHRELKTLKEAYCTWMLLVVAVVVKVPLPVRRTALRPDDEVGDGWGPNKRGWEDVFEGDDFIEDRHTAAGRGKSLSEFARVGAYVVNESPFVVGLHKRFYEDQKEHQDAQRAAPRAQPARAQPSAAAAPHAQPAQPAQPVAVPELGVLRETELCSLLLRVQLNTSASKVSHPACLSVKS